jgi:hypothetical protein
MKRIIATFALSATAACLLFMQIGCSGDAAANSTNNTNPVEKKAVTEKNRKLKTPEILGTQ